MKKVSNFKNHIMVSVIYLAVLAIYNIVVFCLFNDLTPVFWISYVFMTVAVLANVAVNFLSFKTKDVEAAFFGIPLASFSIFHVCAELFTSFIFMLFRQVASVKLTVAIQVILLLIFVIFAVAALLSKNAVQDVNDTVKVNVANIKSLGVDVQLLENQCLDAELKKQLHKVAEGIRFSDPMTNSSVAQLDELIRSKVSELKYLCQNNNKNKALQVCFQLQSYITERNSKLLLLK